MDIYLAFHSAIYGYIRGYTSCAYLYVYVYITGVVIHRSSYSDTRTSPNVFIRVVMPLHAWLYIKCVVIHIYMYSGIPLCHIELLKAKCLPALYYGLEACHVNKSQVRSHEYVLTNTFRKILATKSFDIATDCVSYFGCAVQDTLCRRISNFLTKLKYKTTSRPNLLYQAVQNVVSDELVELQKLMWCIFCMLVLCVVSNLVSVLSRVSFVSILNCIRYECLTLIIYHVVITIVHIS